MGWELQKFEIDRPEVITSGILLHLSTQRARIFLPTLILFQGPGDIDTKDRSILLLIDQTGYVAADFDNFLPSL